MNFQFYINFIIPIMVLIIYIVHTTYKSKNLRNAATIARDENYRKLSEDFIRLQQELKEGQERLLEEQSQISRRITTIEQMLREVD